MEQGWRNIFTPFRLKFWTTIAICIETILLQNMHVKLIYHFGGTSLLLTFVHYTTSHNIYYYSEKHRHPYWVMGTPLSLVGYLSNLQKQLVVLTNEGIWKKIDGDRPFRLTSVIEHSVPGIGEKRSNKVWFWEFSTHRDIYLVCGKMPGSQSET